MTEQQLVLKYRELLKAQGCDKEEIEATILSVTELVSRKPEMIPHLYWLLTTPAPKSWLASEAGSRFDADTRARLGFGEEYIGNTERAAQRRTELRKEKLDNMTPEERQEFHDAENKKARDYRLKQNGGVLKKRGPKPGSVRNYKPNAQQRRFNKPQAAYR